MSDVDFNALGQALDTSFGRSSTPMVPQHSVKFTLRGNTITCMYIAIINFGTQKTMIESKTAYDRDSITIIDKSITALKGRYKDITDGDTLKLKEVATDTALEVIGFAVHNPNRKCYFRRKTMFEIG